MEEIKPIKILTQSATTATSFWVIFGFVVVVAVRSKNSTHSGDNVTRSGLALHEMAKNSSFFSSKIGRQLHIVIRAKAKKTSDLMMDIFEL